MRVRVKELCLVSSLRDEGFTESEHNHWKDFDTEVFI
jgi:hypothetical protein